MDFAWILCGKKRSGNVYCPLEKQYRNVAREKKSSSEFWRAFFFHTPFSVHFSGPLLRGSFFFHTPFWGHLFAHQAARRRSTACYSPCLQSFLRKHALHVTPASVTESNIFCNSFMNASLHLSGCPSLGVNSTWILCGKNCFVQSILCKPC